VLGDHGSSGLETLEKRLVFSFDPATVPSVAELDDPTNPVALIETTLGNIYVELFTDDAPTFVDNFINYLEAGRWADTLFHRLSTTASSGLAVLQGGGFYFTDENEIQTVEAFDAVDDEASPVRAHDERTLSFAKAGPDTATSQWFINLEDNSDLQFLVDQKFTVFGQVVDDDSWAVVQAIAGSVRRDLRSDPNITGDPSAGAFSEVPIRGVVNSTTGFAEENGIYIVGVTMAKVEGADNFFENRLVFPEGYRGPGITTTVELANANDFAVVYQVIIRYQHGEARDQTLRTGTLSANATASIRLFEDGVSGSEIRRRQTYSVEIWSTSRDAGSIGDAVSTPDGSDFVPLVASMRHADSGGEISELFYDASNVGATEQEWLLPRIEVDELNRESFIVFQNLSDTQTTIQIQVFRGDGTVRTINRVVGAHRRGGVRVSNLNLNTGVYGVRLSADEAFVASLSEYARVSGAKPQGGGRHAAWGALGTAGDGATRAYATLVEIPSSGNAYLDVLQVPGAIGSVVTLEAYFDDGSSETSATVTILSANGAHRQINLRDAFGAGVIPDDTQFTLRVNGSAPVASQVTIFYDDLDEAVAAAVPETAGEVAYFSGGSLPGGGGTGIDEVLSIFNPHRASAGVDFQYQIEFRFSDGSTVATGLQSLGDNSRIDISVASSALLADVRTKILSNPTQFSRYAIVVSGFDATGATPQAVPLAAQLLRLGGNTQNAMVNPVYFAGIVPFTSGQFS
jgi:cyclophilin family peptidyl-prolyl cis-trans isomerase